jgi:hypothetical protein
VQAVRSSVPVDRDVHAKEAPTETLGGDGRTAGIKLISAARRQFVNGAIWSLGVSKLPGNRA